MVGSLQSEVRINIVCNALCATERKSLLSVSACDMMRSVERSALARWPHDVPCSLDKLAFALAFTPPRVEDEVVTCSNNGKG